MRVLILLRGYDSLKKHEVGNFELDQAKALKAAGLDVRAIAVDTRSPLNPRRTGCYDYIADGIPVVYASIPCAGLLPGVRDRLSVLGMKMAFARLERSGWKPDIVHAHFLAKGYLFCRLPESDRIPFVITEHSSAVNTDSASPRDREKMRLVYGKAARVLAVGTRLRDYIRQYTGVEARIVPNMLDTSVFTLAPKKQGTGPFRFVSAGNLYRVKGFDILLNALAVLRDRGKSAELTLIGDGEEEAALRQLSGRLGLDGLVTFTGRLRREEMAELYRDADSFVLASRAETFGVAYIEAMAAGLPVIATRCGGPEDFVDGSNGLLVPPEDPAALADAMSRMIRTAGDYDRQAISAFARETYSPQAVTEQILRIYREVLGC